MSAEVTRVGADEIITATQTWLEKAVIGLNLCPFAKAVHVQHRIRYQVSPAQTTADLLEDLARELRVLHTTDAAQCETTLLIHPYVLTNFLEYSFFLPTAEATASKLGYAAEFQLASFHPHYQFRDAEAGAIENYTNRAPYPTLHLLRAASIARAVAAFPDAADIYGKNIATLRELGQEGWEGLWRGGS